MGGVNRLLRAAKAGARVYRLAKAVHNMVNLPITDLDSGAAHMRRRGNRSFSPVLIVLAASLFSGAALPGQAVTPWQRMLLKRKVELLAEMQVTERQRSGAQKTLEEATSFRGMAAAVGQPDQATIYARAAEVAKKAIAAADTIITEDGQRLQALNAALSWPSSSKPRAVSTLVRGHVYKETPHGQESFDPSAPVRLGDRISTGDDGFVELQFNDGSEMHIGPNTDFSYERDVQGIRYELFRGEIHKVSVPVIGVRGANDEGRYQGLHSSAAVRGTDFTLQIVGSRDVFTVFEGEIEVDPGNGRARLVVGAGQRLTVPKTGRVDGPVTFDAKTVLRWWEK